MEPDRPQPESTTRTTPIEASLTGSLGAFECLSIVAGFHQISADPGQIERSLGLEGTPVTPTHLILAARDLGLKARYHTLSIDRLNRATFPVMAHLDDGHWVVIARIEGSQAVIFDPRNTHPVLFTQEELRTQWSGRALLVKTRMRLDNPHRPFDLFWFVPAVLKYRDILLQVLLAALVIQLLALTTPLFTQVIIDKALSHHNVSTMNVLGIGMLIIIVFEGVLHILETHLMAHTSNRIDASLGSAVVKHLLKIPLRYFEVRQVGNTVARVRELENIRYFVTSNSLIVLLDLLFTGIFLAVLFYYSVLLSLIVLFSLPFFVLLSLFIRPMMRHRLDEKFERGAESQSFLIEAVTGMQTIKAMALEPILYRKWENVLARYVTASFRTELLAGTGGAIGQIIQKSANLAILWVGALLVMDNALTVGQLIAFQMISGRVINPVLRLVQLWQSFQQVGLSVERLGDIMNTRAEPTSSAGKSSLPAIQGAVRMESVRFRYHVDGPEVLRNFSIDIAPATVVGLVGRSGSGKSTLAKLLQRLYLPESGRILIDGVDLQQADPMWLRRQIGVVLQENFLFSGTIRENIAIHMPNATLEQVVAVATLAGAHEFILELTHGYDTEVGERGTALSGGQRQRIAIARALLPNPRLLIFDEATSALDYESERIIQHNLASICRGRTVFIVAHRLSTIRQADQILVLDRGELVEQGSHAELLTLGGMYHHLFSLQESGT